MLNTTHKAPGGESLGSLGQRIGQKLARVPVRRWQQLVLLLVVLWLAHSLAQLFWALAPSPDIPPAQISPEVVSDTGGGASQRDVDIATLKSLSVFGTSDPDEAVAEDLPETQPMEPQIEDQAVDTKLALVLQGVISSSDDRSARAIIADAKSQAIYGPGDEIENMRGVEVAKVLDLRVILDNKGQYESLWLYKEDPNAPRIAKRYEPAPDAPSRSWEGDPEEINEGTDGREPQTGPIERDTPNNGRDTGDQEPVSVEQIGQNLSDVVAFNIHRENGQIKGYKVRPGRNPAAFDAVGLEAGDVVTAVNGMALDNPGRIMEIYRNLGQSTSASLEIERDGEIVTIDVELE